VSHLNRGTHARVFGDEVETFSADVKKPEEVRKAIGGRDFDVVVDWIAFTPEDIERDIAMFSGHTRQYVFISSASVYHKPPRHYVITESTPTFNPFWEYSQKKIACEERLRRAYSEQGFPMTIVRPSHTYSTGWMPTPWGSNDFTVPQRMLDGKKVIVHGDGQSLWTLTHTDDFAIAFAGLLGNPDVVGETFQITSEEAITWDQVHRIIGAALGVEPKIVHIPSELIAKFAPEVGPGLIGDKAYSVVFDNSKIKRFVPGFVCKIPFHEGMRRSAQWWREHPKEARIDPAVGATIDRILTKWETLQP
jgi:nucleoside-diphosphate-sugar epimerase